MKKEKERESERKYEKDLEMRVHTVSRSSQITVTSIKKLKIIENNTLIHKFTDIEKSGN